MAESTVRQCFLAVQSGDRKKLESLIGKASVDIKSETTTLLHASVEHDQGEIFQYLLAKNANVGIIDSNGATALHIASKLGRARYIRALLERGASVNSKDLSGATPLHWACQYGQLESCRSLCERGADIESRAKYDTTPLHIACRSNFVHIVQFLLDLKANTEVRTSKALTPLHIAAMKGLSNVAAVLLKYKAQPNPVTMRRCTPLHFAAIQGDIPTVKQLCRYSADVNAIDLDQNTPQTNAVKNGHTYISVFLGRSGYPVFDLIDDDLLLIILSFASTSNLRWFSLTCKRFYQVSQLLWAARCTSNNCIPVTNPRLDFSTHYSLTSQIISYYRVDSSSSVQMEGALLGEINRIGMKNAQPVQIKPETAAMALLDHGVNPNAKQRAGIPAIHLALAKRAYDLVHALVERGGDINAQLPNGNTTLHDSALYSASKPDKLINWLVGIGANPNIVNNSGDTAALHAAKNNQWKCTFLLAKLGCDVNITNRAGEALIHVASSSNGGINIIHQLVDVGADINQAGFAGNSALHITATKGQHDFMQALIERGANLNVVNTCGATALHLAIFYDHFACVSMLITAGCDPNIKNNDGLTPFYFARLLNRTKIIDFLLTKHSVHVSRDKGFFLLTNDGER